MNTAPAPIAPTVPPPKASPADPAKAKLQADADAAIDAAFEGVELDIDDSTPPPAPKPSVSAPSDPKVEPAPEPKKEEPKVSDEKVDPLDAPPEGLEPAPKLSSGALRAQLLEARKVIKEMETGVAQKDTDLETTRKEVETLKKQLEEKTGFVPEKIDYASQPSVKAHTDLIGRDMKAVSLTMGPEGKKLAGNFSTWLRQYIVATNTDGPEGEEAVAKLTETLETELGDAGRRDAMALFGRSLPGYEAAMQEMKRLEADSSNIRTRQSLDQYNQIEQAIKNTLQPMGELPEEAMAAQPYDPATFIARNVANDPKWAARSMEAKKRIAEFLSGVKPLSPEERKTLEANDTGGLSTIEDDRKKKYSEDRNQWAKRLYQGTMILPMFKALYEELETLRASKSAEDSEQDALDKVDEKKVVPITQPKKAPVENAGDFNRFIDDIFDGKPVPA